MGSGHTVYCWTVLLLFCYVWVANSVNGESEYIFELESYNVDVPAQGPGAGPSAQGPGAGPSAQVQGPSIPYPESSAFSVIDFGAIGDGLTDDTDAFLQAWQAACATVESILIVPPGPDAYLLNSVEFKGPCGGSIELQINGILRAYPDGSSSMDHWIMFSHVTDLTVRGTGIFDGNGEVTWQQRKPPLSQGASSSPTNAPTAIKFYQVTNGLLEGITSSNSKMFHILVHQCHNIMIQGVTVSAPGDSPNTDGIHIGNSDYVNVFDSSIQTGDDCISIGGGSTNINVTNVQCGPGHGISIGSLGLYQTEDPVAEISVTNCYLTDTTNGLRIKSYTQSPESTAYDITFSDINMTNVNNPIIIDQQYCPHDSCNQGGESNIAISNVKFINVRGTSASPTAIKLICSQTVPCQAIEFTGVSLTFNGQPTVATCLNAQYMFVTPDQVPPDCSAPVIYTNLQDAVTLMNGHYKKTDK